MRAGWNGAWVDNRDLLFNERNMDTYDDLDINMDYDRHSTRYSAGWRNADEFRLCMRSLGLLGEYTVDFRVISGENLEILISPSLLAPSPIPKPDGFLPAPPQAPKPLALQARLSK